MCSDRGLLLELNPLEGYSYLKIKVIKTNEYVLFQYLETCFSVFITMLLQPTFYFFRL